MATTEPGTVESDVAAASRRRRWRAVAFTGVGVIAAIVGYGWLSRERIADNLIAGQLESLGLPARYKVESIGLRRQVLRDVVIGDPARPDLTIARVEATIEPRWGAPRIGRITLVRPRLFGTYLGGKLSFGRLDPVIFAKSDKPFRLPDLDIAIRDGRGLVEGDIGDVAVKVEGEGHLRHGFAGILAAVAPAAAVGGCTAADVSLYGAVRIERERPRFDGPLRSGRISCPGQSLALAKSVSRLAFVLDPKLDGGEGRISLDARSLSAGGVAVGTLGGKGRLAYRKGLLTAHYDLTGARVASPQATATKLALSGSLRAAEAFSRLDAEGEVSGQGVATGNGLDRALADLRNAGEGTLAAPLLEQVRAALARESRGSTFKAAYVARRNGDAFNLILPQGALRGGSGQALLSLSRVQIGATQGGGLRIAGNFATGGRGLPRVAGRMERGPAGQLLMRMEMPEYAAGGSRIAIPHLLLAQSRDGALGFAGQAVLSGALPGGQARNLAVPLDGNWSSRAGLSLWRKCIELGFDRLVLANLTLERRRLPVCPQRGRAIVQADGRGVRVAAGAPALDIAGRLGATPIRIASGPIGFAMPGHLAARRVNVALGPAATASRFVVSDLSARIGRDIAGNFSGADVLLAAVPLDLRDATGGWRFADGRLSISDAAFRLEDRETLDRFQPLVARGASLQLADNVISAEARLAEPQSGREVVRTAIRHDLAQGSGHADLAVDSLVFDDRLQPDMVTRQALGVVANVNGTVRGNGRIEWTDAGVTSNGRFSTENMDFAAAFGPVKGASGTIEFTDLLGLVTAPDQRLRVASINPGVEVLDGDVHFQLEPGGVLQVKGGEWPFLGGTLALLPVRMNLGVAEERHYTLTITALDAAKLVEQMGLANIVVTGTFDGVIPLIFDQNGGRIEQGLLKSRSGGGNVAYVGALTYKDLSPMANFAFDALRSIDYSDMRVEMNGPLEGEIVTRVMFDGVRQGAGARRNFVTRAVANLPIRFNLNIKAAFFQLISSLRSIYDPAYLRDPRSLGLMDDKGNALVLRPGAIVPAREVERDIQQPASGKLP